MVRSRLITEDANCLDAQLQNEGIRVLLVNGNGVWSQLKAAMAGRLELVHHETIKGLCYQPTHLDSGWLLGKIRVIAWSTNLQSSFGVTSELRDELAKRVATFYSRIRE